MKRISLIFGSLLLSIGLFGCQQDGGTVKAEETPKKQQGESRQASNNDDKITVNNHNTQKKNNKKDVREVVWGQLPALQKERINGTWKDGKVSKVTLEKNMMSEIKDKSYEEKEVYRIMFPKDGKSEPNFMVFYADVKTFNYIGYALVR
ncbi:hypothetical protein [Terrihalobacillus insolitus]|uniref:hypothetical protein n=1 Tax=Terrihalobacillus insolitus TaxID=2950438 RepID=UPI002342148D|nr:hypothetical protein [Terrihalobacillus insolitus]MDC3415206.1 hypothetical protein [Terrihalobacillus insolitus]